jgi:hypothetical protein
MKRDAARHETGLHEDPLADRVAFVVVTVEDGVVRSCERRVDLPSEVRRVLNAGVHALPAHGGVDVRRISRQEHATIPVLGDLSFIAVESGHPSHLEHAEVGLHCPPKDADDLVLIDRFVVGHLVFAVPYHRAIPRTFRVVAFERGLVGG